MDIVCDVSDNGKSWCLTWETSWAHQELYCQKRKGLSCHSIHILPDGGYDLALPNLSVIMRLLSLLFYERQPWQDIGMMFDLVLRTEISVDSIIRTSENHAPWPTQKLDWLIDWFIPQECISTSNLSLWKHQSFNMFEERGQEKNYIYSTTIGLTLLHVVVS